MRYSPEGGGLTLQPMVQLYNSTNLAAQTKVIDSLLAVCTFHFQ